MSHPEEVDDMLEDVDSGVGDGDGSTHEDEEEEVEYDFINAGQDTASNRLSLRMTSESCKRAEVTQKTILLVP